MILSENRSTLFRIMPATIHRFRRQHPRTRRVTMRGLPAAGTAELC